MQYFRDLELNKKDIKRICQMCPFLIGFEKITPNVFTIKYRKRINILIKRDIKFETRKPKHAPRVDYEHFPV